MTSGNIRVFDYKVQAQLLLQEEHPRQTSDKCALCGVCPLGEGWSTSQQHLAGTESEFPARPSPARPDCVLLVLMPHP